MDTTKSLDLGPAHTYTTGTGDGTITLFDTDTWGTTYRANPRVRSEADSLDARVARKTAVSSNLTVAGEASNLVFTLYLTPTTPTKILANKELILLQAEVNWGLGQNIPALALADFIRRTAGNLLTDTTPRTSASSLPHLTLSHTHHSLLRTTSDPF